MTAVARAAVAFVLVAGAGPAGFLIYHTVFDSHPLHPAQASAPAALGLGSAAPLSLPGTVALPDSNGTLHHLAEYRGHPLVLNFWATWCEPCQREIPLLATLAQEHSGSVQIVGVAVDFQADVLRYAQAHGIRYPLLMGEKDGLAAVHALGMETVFPFTVFADSAGDILAVKRGELHADEAHLILDQLTAVDAGRTGLGDARNAISLGLRSLSIARAQQRPAPSAGLNGKS